jgi:hypothetical protein
MKNLIEESRRSFWGEPILRGVQFAPSLTRQAQLPPYKRPCTFCAQHELKLVVKVGAVQGEEQQITKFSAEARPKARRIAQIPNKAIPSNGPVQAAQNIIRSPNKTNAKGQGLSGHDFKSVHVDHAIVCDL